MRDKTGRSLLVKSVRAATQLTPYTAVLMKLADDEAEEKRQLQLARTIQVIEHRLQNANKRQEDIEKAVAGHAELLARVKNSQTDLHAFIAGLMIANASMSNREIISKHYLDQVLSLGYAEILVLFDCSGHIIDDQSERQIEELKNSGDGFYSSIVDTLKAKGLLNPDAATLPDDLADLIEFSE